MENKTKKCGKCGEEKNINEFNKDKRRYDGCHFWCKSCCSQYNKIRYSDPEYKEKHNNASLKWYIDNKEKASKQNKEWIKNNLDQYNLNNKNRYNNDVQYRLRKILRNSLNTSLKLYGNRNKTNSADILLSCSLKYFIEYIKTKFLPEMNWDNHGEVWEIDHIIPISSFDLTLLEEQQKCFHYTNLQPLFKTTEIAESFGYTDQIGNRNKQNKIL